MILCPTSSFFSYSFSLPTPSEGITSVTPLLPPGIGNSNDLVYCTYIWVLTVRAYITVFEKTTNIVRYHRGRKVGSVSVCMGKPKYEYEWS